MNKPTLSALITYHNERELLRDCVASFLSQNPPPDEILIHDDASAAPAEAYLPDGFHGTILHAAQNRGPARARNALWHESRSDWVHFHDADDIVLPGWSARVRAAMTEGVDAVFTEIRSRRDAQLVSSDVLGLRRHAPGQDLVRFCLQGAMLVPAGTYRRRLVESVNGYRESLWQAEDFDFNVRIAARLGEGASESPRYRMLADPLVEIRLRPDSRSQDERQVWSEALKALGLLAGELSTGYADDLSDAAARVGARLFRLGAEQDARRAFALAERLGKPTFGGEGLLYRCVAHWGGPERAERWGRWYRQCLPPAWRQNARRWSERKSA